MFLEYQPIVGGKSGSLEDIEALIRWRHPQRGLVMPDSFIPVIERDANLIDRITMWVVRTASEQLKRLDRVALANMSVNISAKNLTSLDFPDQLLDLVTGLDRMPNSVTLEITETATAANPRITTDILTRLRLKGFRLAMDDFGTGFSSLKGLLNSPFSQLKIDKSFVSSMLTSRDARAIVKSVADLARNMGLKTVAEGAESQAVVDQLLDFGVDGIQGYHISRPLPSSQLSAWHAGWSQPGRRLSGGNWPEAVAGSIDVPASETPSGFTPTRRRTDLPLCDRHSFATPIGVASPR
jgi:EAL domain-containing protein (putative c-di-GMP-specific phosphodiesterase class I)